MAKGKDKPKKETKKPPKKAVTEKKSNTNSARPSLSPDQGWAGSDPSFGGTMQDRGYPRNIQV